MEHAPEKESHEYLNSKFDVKYVPEKLKTSDDGFTFVWNDSLKDGKKRGDHPYYCPIGWQKYGLMVAHCETAKVCKN